MHHGNLLGMARSAQTSSLGVLGCRSLSLLVYEGRGGEFPVLESVPTIKYHGLVHHVDREEMLSFLSLLWQRHVLCEHSGLPAGVLR